jgi:hypothetical protein
MGHVTMYFLVAWISRISFMLVRAVGEHGAGCVVRNIAVSITTRPRARNHRRLRTITRTVVEKKLDSRKKTIVLEGIIRIVQRGGKKPRAKP